jgi:hypothetical protein
MLEKLARVKRYCLVVKFVNYGCKNVYLIGPWSDYAAAKKRNRMS